MFGKAQSMKDIAMHLLVMLGIFIAIVILFFYIYLPMTTKHGETVEVPKLVGKSLEEIEQVLDDKNLRYQINDSSYSPGMKANTILDQNPEAGTQVKENRKIYITVSSLNPPKVKMPKLIDGSLKSAEITLKGYGLEVGAVKNVPSPYLNLVLEQQVNGKNIEPGSYIPKGSKIDLSVGDGAGGGEVDVPNLVGMTIEDAKQVLIEKGLMIGLEEADASSTATTGTVTKQKPNSGSLKSGDMIDVWIAE